MTNRDSPRLQEYVCQPEAISTLTMLRIQLIAICVLFVNCVWADNGNSANADWEAYQAVYEAALTEAAQQMTHEEYADYMERRFKRLRELGLAFIEAHGTDPRRWIVVQRFHPAVPRFVIKWTDFDEEGHPINPVVDVAAAAGWKAKVAELKAAMAVASDLPEVVLSAIDSRTVAKQKLQATVSRARSGKEDATDFMSHDMFGREVRLSDLRGKVVVLDFWATWCGPCKKAMPSAQKIAASYKSEGVVVLAVCSWDARSEFEKWMKKYRSDYPDIVFVYDPAGRAVSKSVAERLYGATVVPWCVVINASGKIVDLLTSQNESEVALEAALKKVLRRSVE